MNKRKIIAITTLFVIAIVAILLLGSNNIFKNDDEPNTFKEKSNLDIVINLGNYSKEYFDDSKLLEVSMLLAKEYGLVNKYSDDSSIIEYVNKEDLHNIMSELTGNTIEAPIEIEDFYYQYDSENDYYYFRPAVPNYYSVSKVTSIDKNGNNYRALCNASKNEDSEIAVINNIQLDFTYIPKNKYVKYQVNKIQILN